MQQHSRDIFLLKNLANIFLVTRYSLPLRVYAPGHLPLRAALILAPHLRQAQERAIDDVYDAVIRQEPIVGALYDTLAPEAIGDNLSEQHLLNALPILAHAEWQWSGGVYSIQRALQSIHERLGYAFFESAIHTCLNHDRVSQPITMRQCVRAVCDAFPDDILSLAQRYGDLMIRLHGAEPFVLMLRYWCEYQALRTNRYGLRWSREALVEAFDSPLTRAAAMIVSHPRLSPAAWDAIEATFDRLPFEDRLTLLLSSSHDLSLGPRLRLLGLDPTLEPADCLFSDYLQQNAPETLVRCLINIPAQTALHVSLGEASRRSPSVCDLFIRMLRARLQSDHARAAVARAIIYAPATLQAQWFLDWHRMTELVQNLSDADLRTALEHRIAQEERVSLISRRLCDLTVYYVEKELEAKLRQWRDSADIADAYLQMIQDKEWLFEVDCAVGEAMNGLVSMSAAYSISDNRAPLG